MLRIGLTGGIGSGKSTVAHIFSILNINIYDSDARAKMLMLNQPVKSQIIDLLGQESYSERGINRKWIAKQVFADKKLLQQLNDVVHPAVHEDFIQWCSAQTGAYVIQESALTFETGNYLHMDTVITVNAPEEIRIERVMQRDGVLREQVEKRMESQWLQSEKLRYAEFVIENDGKSALIPQVLNLHARLINLNAQLATFDA